MPKIRNGNHTVNVRVEGAGEPVLLLHSAGFSGTQWTKLVSLLKDRYQVIVPDLHGYGESSPWPAKETFSHEQDVEFLARYLDGLRDPAHIVGHSYGAFVALQLALRRPVRLRSLALYDPVAFGVLRSSGHARGVMDLEKAANEVAGPFPEGRSGGDDIWVRSFIDYWNGAGSYDAMPEAKRGQLLALGRKMYWEVAELTSDRTPHWFYENITAPALILTGSRTTPAASGIARILAQTLPAATLHEIRDAGHMGPVTHAAEVNRAVASFLDTQHGWLEAANG